MAVQQTATVAATTAIGTSVLSNFALGMPLSLIWSMVNGLQTVVHMPLFNVQFPRYAFVFLSGLIIIANFEPLPDEYTDFFTTYPERGPFNERFDMANYGSVIPFANSSTDFFFFKLFLGMFVLAILISEKCVASIPFCGRIKSYIEKRLYWTIPIRYFYEGYLELSIVFLISLMKTSWTDNNFDLTFSNLISAVFMLVLLAYPIFVHCKYQRNYHRLDEEKFKGKYGDLFEGY